MLVICEQRIAENQGFMAGRVEMTTDPRLIPPFYHVYNPIIDKNLTLLIFFMINKFHLKTVGKGHPLIMLHGWGWHSDVWQPLIPALEENFQLFLIDLPGFGKSPMLTSHYTLEAITSKIFDIIPTHAAWLGWSLGGMLAWWVAIHYPEKVDYLVTVASTPKFVSDINWPGVAMPTLEKFSETLIENPQKTLQDFLTLQLRGSPKNHELFSELKNILLSTQQPTVSALQGGLELLRNTDLRKDIHQVTAPSLHIFGSHDTLVPPSIINILQPLLPNSRFEMIKRAGHMPFLSQPEVFLELLCQFITYVSHKKNSVIASLTP